MRKDREFYSFFIQTLQTSSSLICQMFLYFCKIQLPCLVYDTLPPGCYGSVFISIASMWIHTRFFFVFVFQFYIIHPVRSRVLYHSYSVNFDCYPFFLSRFSLFFFLFSSFSKMHRRCSCRGEEMLCLLSCSGWVLQLQAQVQLFFFFGIFV